MDNLVFQIQQDSEYAFKQLYQIYYAKVVSFITGIIKERDIAKDLLNNTIDEPITADIIWLSSSKNPIILRIHISNSTPINSRIP